MFVEEIGKVREGNNLEEIVDMIRRDFGDTKGSEAEADENGSCQSA